MKPLIGWPMKRCEQAMRYLDDRSRDRYAPVGKRDHIWIILPLIGSFASSGVAGNKDVTR
jgi:hypothetical protein